MLLGHYVVVLLCYCNIMLLGYYVVMLLCYYVIRVLHDCNITTEFISYTR